MEVYKLKQLYPGLPKDWEVGMVLVSETSLKESLLVPRKIKGGKNYSYNIISMEIIKNFPEFFEGPVKYLIDVNGRIVVPGDCVRSTSLIGTLCANGNGSFFVRTNSGSNISIGMVACQHTTSLELYDKEYPLSYDDLINGEIYTIYYPKQGLYTFKEGYNLYINHDIGNVYTFNNGDFTPSNGFTSFRLATEEEKKMLEVRKLVFTTEDKVDIYEDMLPMIVNSVHPLGAKVNKTLIKDEKSYLELKKPDAIFGEVFKFFSKESAANDWIILNTKCLSIEDVAKVYKTANKFPEENPNSQGNQLRELVNKYLNKK